MKILQFAFTKLNSPHLPHAYDVNTVVYTGTHDNDTARGWFESATDVERKNAEAYLGLNSHGDVEWSMIRTVFTSVAQIAVIPVQDILGLGSDARMNRPGDGEANWAWRLREGALDREHAEKLRRLTELSGRL